MQMTNHQFTAGLIAAALAFRQKLDAESAKTAARKAVSSGEDDVPDEVDEEALWEQFADYVSTQGIPKTVDNPDIECFAGLNKGEPSFVLRGQDILASMIVRHWVALYEGLAPEAVERKIVQAEGIAEKMEMYGKQKWAD